MLILTEAGADIGFGHLTRMMALGDALVQAGVDLHLLVQWEGMPIHQIVEDRTWVRDESWRADPVGLLRHRDATSVLIDSYRLPLVGFCAIARAGFRLLVIDDFYRLPFPAELVINPNVYAEPQRYLDSAQKAVGGQTMILLRAEFAKAAGSHPIRPELLRILITLGGAELHGLGLRLAQKLAANGILVEWIAPGQEGEDIPGIVRHDAVGADAFVQLVRRADLTICGGGQTLHELACLGAPCIALELGDDQQLNLDFYEGAGLLGKRLHRSSRAIIETVCERVDSLREVAVRTQLASLGRGLIDGGGAGRLANVIKKLS